MQQLSIIEDPEARHDLQELAKRYNSEMIADRGMDMEAQILEIIRDMLPSPYGAPQLPLKDYHELVCRSAWNGLRAKGHKQMDRKHHPKAAKSQNPKKPRNIRDTAFGAAEA